MKIVIPKFEILAFFFNFKFFKKLMPKEFPEIYFSYAWGDKNLGKDSIEFFIDELYQSLDKADYPVKRDKMDSGYGNLISDFMKEIGEADLIVIGISDKYLRSHYCMWELCEIYRNSNLDAKKFILKLLPIRIEDINFDPQSKRKYIEYWEERYNEINKLISDHPDSINPEDQKDQQKIRTIRHNLTAVIGQVKDINSLTKALLQENDFESIKNEINYRIKSIPLKASEIKSNKFAWNEINKDYLSTLFGDWDLQPNVSIFNKGDHIKTPVGVTLGPTIFYEAEIEVDVVFKKLRDLSGDVLDTSAKILFNYNTDDSSYYCIGIGGYSYKYSIVEFKKNNDQWQWAAIKTSGDPRSLKENHAYKLRTRISHNIIELFENNALIFRFDIIVQKELQIGLFAWGTNPIEFRNFRYKILDSEKNTVTNLVSDVKKKLPDTVIAWYHKYHNTIIGSFIFITSTVLFIIFGNKINCNMLDTRPKEDMYKRIELKLDLSDSLFNIYKDSLSFSFVIDSIRYKSTLSNKNYYFDGVPNSYIGKYANISVNLNNKEIHFLKYLIDTLGIQCYVNEPISKYYLNFKNHLVDTNNTSQNKSKLTFSVSSSGMPLKNTEIKIILNDTLICKLYSNEFGIAKYQINKFTFNDKIRIIASKSGYKLSNSLRIYDKTFLFNELSKEIYISFKKRENNSIDKALLIVKINQISHKVEFVNSETIRDLVNYLKINEGEVYMRNHLNCFIYVNGNKIDDTKVIRETILTDSHINLICDERMATRAMKVNEIKLINSIRNNNIKVKINNLYTKIKKISTTESVIYSYNLVEGDKNTIILYDFDNNIKYIIDKFESKQGKEKSIELTTDFKLIQK